MDLAIACERGAMSSSEPCKALEIIKAEPGTLVWSQPCLEAECAGVFKLYRHINPIKLLRSKISKGRRVVREFNALTRLYEAGVPCSQPLDWHCGFTRDAGICETLVTKCIEGSISLEQVGQETGRFAQLDFTLLYQIVRRAHACGVYHGALSPRNILMTGDGATSPGFYLIDMERAVLFPYDIVGTRMARRDLLALSSYIVRHEGAARIPSFLSAYGLAQDEQAAFMEALCRFRSSSVGRDLAAMEFGLRAAIERRWGIDSPGWLRTKSVDDKGQSLEIYCRSNHPEWIEIAKQYWNAELPGMVEIKSHAWGGITQSGQVPGVGTCYFKRFSIRSLRFIHKPIRGRHTLKHQEQVSELGFDVPEVVCLIERRKAGIVLESAVIASELKDQHSLNSILNLGNGDIVRSRSDKRELLRTLGREVGRRHALGLFHGDLHLGNIFCKRAENRFALSWIDNEEGSCWKHLPMRLRLHDLDHINRFKHKLSLSERMLVWKTYVLAAGLPIRLQRKVLRRVIGKSQRFWRKKGWMS